MFIRKIVIDKYRVLENICINFEKMPNNSVFPIISLNGGGKSTLLQFVFMFLHCPFRKNRFEYIRNFLQGINPEKNKEAISKLAEFELEHEGNIISLEFYYANKDYKKLSFDAILTLEELGNRKIQNIELAERIDVLNKLEDDIQNSRISDALIRRELERLERLGSLSKEVKLVWNNLPNKVSYIEYISRVKKITESKLISDDELDLLIIQAKALVSKLEETLKNENLEYALHFKDNQHILLYKSNVKKDILSEISDKVYLATPNTQVLHFLSEKQLSSLFSNEKFVYSSYESSIKESQGNLFGLFTYDFSVIALILGAFQKARDEDFAKAIETGSYGNQIKKTTEELNNLLHNKIIVIDKDFKSVSFKSKDANIRLSPKDLSHGELKKLSIYIWIKAKTSNDAVILMDEVDMGLHPTWQHELCNDLQKWNIDSQFILATHSPQIIGKAHYKNLVVLTKISETSNNSTSEQFNEAPLDSDLNTIVKTIMGGEYIPKELQELHKNYRTFVDNNKTNSKEAQKIKGQILEYESENSSFFQNIKFELAFRQ